MRRPWLLATLSLLLVLVLAHARSLRAAWTGEVTYSYGFELCDAHFVSKAAPAARLGRPTAEGCDTLHSQRMAWDSLRRVEEAWETRESTLSFLTSDLWRVAIGARALNMLDLMLFVWPARAFLPPAAGLVLLHLGLVALAGLSGIVFARTLRASPLAGLASGLVVGGSGLVLESIQRGQYPQAVLTGALFFFAGLLRIVRGERFGVALASGGAAFAALLYWQNGLILGVGALVFLIGSRVAGPFAPGAWKRLLAAAALSLTIAAIPAVPVIEVLLAGNEQKMKMVAWGTPYPVVSGDPDAHVDLIDEVPYFVLLSPRSGWLPVLPLLPLALLGLVRRAHAAWALVAGLGLVLVLGPLPVVPDGFGGGPSEGYGAMNRRENPFYTAAYQWVPTASRQRHPMRWGTLLVVGMAAVTVLGVDAARKRWPDHVWIAVLAGAGWTAWVGPWPLRQTAFPQEAVDKLAGCSVLVVPKMPGGDRGIDDLNRLEGLVWIPRAPVRNKGNVGVGEPTEGMRAWSEPYEKAATERLVGAPAREPDPLVGTCLLHDASWVGPEAERVQAALRAAYGEPDAVLETDHLFMADGETRHVEIYRP